MAPDGCEKRKNEVFIFCSLCKLLTQCISLFFYQGMVRTGVFLRNILYKRDLGMFVVFLKRLFTSILFSIFAAEFVYLGEFIWRQNSLMSLFSASFWVVEIFLKSKNFLLKNCLLYRSLCYIVTCGITKPKSEPVVF